jgi:Flp pilus assembly protein TadG
MRRRKPAGDAGNAMVEFVFLGILMLIPLVYLVLAISYVQRNTYGVTEAAREIGRTYATSGNAATARYAAKLALGDQNIADSNLDIGWAPAGSGCTSATPGLPQLTAGEVFSVCVTRHITIPAVPSFIGARHNTVTGRFVVHVDDYR